MEEGFEGQGPHTAVEPVMMMMEKLHELQNLYSSPNTVRVMTSNSDKRGRPCSTQGELLAVTSESTKPLGIPRHRWDDNIKMQKYHHKKIKCEVEYQTNLAIFANPEICSFLVGM
jgi:hypothetical protein